ncbi:MAG: type IV pilus assembly protein PilM [Planctomycetota bacterium]
MTPMLSGLLSKRRWPIGLDIGTAVVRMLQLQRVGGNVSVVSAGKADLPPGSHAGPGRPQAVAEAIRSILAAGHFRGRRVVSALSCKDMHVKNVRMPAMSDRELVGAVRWEADERFPFQPTDDQLRWIKAGQIRQGTDVREEVIMMAAQPGAVEKHLDLLSDVGLVAAHIEPEPLALFRAFSRFLRRQGDEQAVNVVVDVGHSGTRVTVARGRRVVFVKALDISGQQFTQAVAKHLNLSPGEAAELRLRMMREGEPPRGGTDRGDDGHDGATDAGTKDWTLWDAMRPQAEALAREISLCLRYCSVTFRGLRPQKLVLIGGESADAALVELLGENIGVECVVGEPLRGVDVRNMGVDAATRRGALAEWGVCTGLAMRETNLENVSSETCDDERRLSA